MSWWEIGEPGQPAGKVTQRILRAAWIAALLLTAAHLGGWI